MGSYISIPSLSYTIAYLYPLKSDIQLKLCVGQVSYSNKNVYYGEVPYSFSEISWSGIRYISYDIDRTLKILVDGDNMIWSIMAKIKKYGKRDDVIELFLEDQMINSDIAAFALYHNFVTNTFRQKLFNIVFNDVCYRSNLKSKMPNDWMKYVPAEYIAQINEF